MAKEKLKYEKKYNHNLKNIDNILGNDTKKGLCHVLVNDGKIKSWVKVDYDEVI